MQRGVRRALEVETIRYKKTYGILLIYAAALLLLGGAYLVIRRVIRLRIPVCYLGTVALLSYFFPPAGVADPLEWMLYQP
ncbi:RnfABCDGE type electron transport complex subunit D, partial [Bacteroides thetaiotaomicron]